MTMSNGKNLNDGGQFAVDQGERKTHEEETGVCHADRLSTVGERPQSSQRLCSARQQSPKLRADSEQDTNPMLARILRRRVCGSKRA